MGNIKIRDLIEESTKSNSNMNAGPALQALTRATRALIYEDLVAVQETDQPSTALYGVRYLNSDGNLSYLSHATYSGLINSRNDIEEVEAKSYVKGDLFKDGDIVYIVTNDFTLGATDVTSIGKELIGNNIRYLTDNSDLDELEEVADVGVVIDKWQTDVKTRALKTSFTLELLQDMEHNQLLGKNVPFDLLTTIIAEDTNKDICQKLLHVSKKYGDGVYNIKFDDENQDPVSARKVYRIVNEMAEELRRQSSFKATYILASTKVCGILKSSGWVKPDPQKPLSEGILKNGLHLYSDDTSPIDYAIAGFKHVLGGELELVSSMFYSPYTSTYLVATDPKSFNKNIMIKNRYSLSVNPYTAEEELSNKSATIIIGDDWDSLGGKSLCSNAVMFIFE